MCATVAGTPSLFRRKSITRYRRLLPPPWWRVVIRPWTLRPALLRPLATSDFSGLLRVSSSKLDTLAPRRPGGARVVELALVELDRVAGAGRADGERALHRDQAVVAERQQLDEPVDRELAR